MRLLRPRSAVAAAVGLAAWFGLASPAAAASLSVTPSTVAAGGSVTVTGSCSPNSPGFAISSAFLHDATHDFAGVGAVSFTSDASGNFSATASVPASRAPGSYTVTARCGGGNLGVEATLTVTGGSGLALTGRPLGQLVALGAGLLVLGALALVSGSVRRGRAAGGTRP